MKKPRICPKKKTCLFIVAIAAAIAILFLAINPTLQPTTLNLYFKGGNTIQTNDSGTLVVEYQNTLGRDIETLDIQVKPIHNTEEEIKLPEKDTEHEEQIGKGQLRQFQFPVSFTGLREGSTYAIEVKAITPQENVSKRISVKVEESTGGE